MADGHDSPLTGAIPVAVGLPSAVRVPIPGEPRLAVELWPRNFKGTSTCTLFIHDPIGRKGLRLDYSYNKTTNMVDYHWNQRGVHARFGITDHTVAGRAGAIAYRGAQAYRWAGRVLVVFGIGVDVVSVVQADQPLRRATQVVSAWALAWAGCKGVGWVGGLVGTAVEPALGTAAGAIGGCIIGGYGGYRAGEAAGDLVYQWAADTVFTRLPEAALP